MNTVCISTKMSTPEKVGDKTQGVSLPHQLLSELTEQNSAKL